MKNKILNLLLIGLFLSQVAWTAHPQQVQTIRIGAYENAPKIFTDKNGEITGFWPDVMRQIAAEENWKIEWVHGDWEDLLVKLLKNEIDILPDMGWTQSRSQIYAFNSETVLISWTRLYVRRGLDIETLLDLQGKTVGALSGSFNLDGPEGLRELAQKFELDITILEMDDYTQVFEAVQDGKIDAGITNKDFGNLNEDEYDVVRTAIIFQPARIQFAFTKNAALTPYLIERIDSRLDRMKVDYNSIYFQSLEKYLGDQASGAVEQVIPPWVFALLGLTVGILLFLLGVGYGLRSQLRLKTVELHEHQAMLQAVVNTTTDSVFVKDIQGRYILFNPGTEAVLGRKAKDSLGKDDHAIFPENASYVIAIDREILARGEVLTYEEILPDAGGVMHTFLTTKGPLVDESGKQFGLFGIARDITERKLLEEQAVRAAQDWQTTFDASNAAIWILDKEFKILQSNEAAEHIFHRPRGEMIGCYCWEIVQGTTEPPPTYVRLQLATSLRRESMEVQAGETWLDITVDPILDAEGHLNGAVHVVTDITGRKQSELQLNQQLEELHRWHAITLGRETRVLELKREVNDMLAAVGKPPRYPSAADAGDMLS